ncbi:MAG: type II secretion system protein [Patescibacteria group bacterium]
MSKGYTLIELLVVLAIIGILAAIGITTLNGTRGQARDATRFSDFEALRGALELYADTYGSYPRPVTAGGAGPDLSTAGLNGTIFSQTDNPLSPAYMSRSVRDPINDATKGLYYYYDTNDSPTVNHRNYVICFHKESRDQQRFYYYSTAVQGYGPVCPTLPAT